MPGRRRLLGKFYILNTYVKIHDVIRSFNPLQPHRRPDDIGVNDTWYDEVDLSLCFEDTAILYAICIIFWLLAALRFVFHTKQPPLPFSKLNITKIVSEYC